MSTSTATNQQPGEMIRLVILDDHPVVREGLRFILDRQSDISVVADSGTQKDALQLVEEFQPDIILLDVHMEGPTFGLYRKVKLIRPDVKVVFITAYDTEQNFEQASRIGADGLVSKLESEDSICDALRAIHKGETYFSRRVNQYVPAAKKAANDNSNRGLPVHHPLSPREVDVLCCVAHAMSAKEIANDLHISVKTVDRHKANIMDKLNMRSQIELARYAIRHGFVEA